MFKTQFKYFKKKCPPPDFSCLLDFKDQDSVKNEAILRSPTETEGITSEEISSVGLVPPHLWKIYELRSCPGLLVVENPFDWSGQRYWASECLRSYPAPPNRLNLHAHGVLQPTENWWQVCNSAPDRRSAIYKQLRWVTMGYHHNWDTKIYSEEEKSDVPKELVSLSSLVARVVGGWEFTAQAVIVNYYHLDSTLSGHTDHSEINLQAPLLSFSFGQSAVFLIGGESGEDEARGVRVRSGDVVVMSGRSRLCYHGVPRVLASPSRPWDPPRQHPPPPHDPVWPSLQHYLSSSRININVRQVLHRDQQTLSQTSAL